MSFTLYYNGTDVTEESKVSACIMHDRAGGEADYLTAIFSDSLDQWPAWGPQRGDTMRLVDGDFNSGELFVDDPQLQNGSFRVEALSTPVTAKRQKTRIWREVHLMGMINDVAQGCGLSVQTYGVSDYTYSAISQNSETDLAFLARVCAREGYAVKVTGGALVVYNEKNMENQPPQKTITPNDVTPGFTFGRGVGMLQQVEVVYFNPKSGQTYRQTATAPNVEGGTAKIKELCSNDGEAQRFARGFLRMANKEGHLGRVTLLQQSDLAAGSTIQLQDFGPEKDGAWYVYGVDQDAMHATTTLLLRRPLSY